MPINATMSIQEKNKELMITLDNASSQDGDTFNERNADKFWYLSSESKMSILTLNQTA
jgi:hypothetical protein